MGYPRRAQDAGADYDPGSWLRCGYKAHHVGQSQSDYEILFRLMDRLRPDAGRRYWIREHGAEGNIVDIGEEIGTDGNRSQNRLPDVPQYLDNRRGVRTMKEYRLKVEIAQRN
jgi:hypothetical protein